MKIHWFLLILLCASASAKNIQSHRIEWFKAHQATLVARIHNSTKNDLVPVMDTLGQLWLRKDGALGPEVAPFIAEVIIKRPDIAFSWFVEHQDAFSAFMNQAQTDLFTNYSGEQAMQLELENLKERLTTSTVYFSTNTPSNELTIMAKKLSIHIKMLKIEEID